MTQDATQNRKVSILLGVGIFILPFIFAWFTLRKGYSPLARGISFAWMIVFFLIPGTTQDNNSTTSTNSVASTSEVQQTAKPEEQEPAPVQIQYMQVSASEIFQAYDANEMAADQRYKGQPLEVTGTIESISSDFSDDAVVNLETGQMFMSVMATGNKDFNSQAVALSKGQRVTLLCEGGGEIAGSPVLRKCEVAQ